MSAAHFRGLIVLSVLLAVCGAAVDTLFPTLIPQSLSVALENEPPHNIFDNLVLSFLLFVPLGVLAIASTVGLFFLKRWARSLALASTALGFGMYPFLGPSVGSAWASAFSDASSLAWGAVLAIAYFSPLRDRFSSVSR